MKLIFTWLITALALSATAQSTFITQVQTITGGYPQFSKCIQLSDGTFIAIGNCPSSNRTGNAILLVKMDEVGRVTTSKAVEILNQSLYVASLIKTADGGFAIAGTIEENSYVFKFKSDLTPDWEKKLTGNENGNLSVYTMCQKKDGSYLLGCHLSDFAQDNSGALLLGISATGDVISSQRFLIRGINSNYVITGVAEMRDGNEALLVSAINTTAINDSCLLIKTTPDGNILWANVLKTSELGTVGLSVLASGDNSIVIAGASSIVFNFGGTNYPSYQTLMAKFDENGTQKWVKHLTSGLLFQSYFYSVTEDKAGNYVFGGTGSGLNPQQTSLEYFNYFASLSPDGSLMWTRKTGKSPDFPLLQLSSFTATIDGGFAACGNERSFDPEGTTIFSASLYKYGSTFESCTGEAADSIGDLTANGSTESMELIGDSITVTSTDFVTDVNNYGTFVYPCNSILPVTLLSFTAQLSGNLVNVDWKTANEINADYYTVEKSSNGNSFSDVQKVSAKGGSTGTFSYTTADVSPLPGTSYYRLKQTDRDGHVTYSSVAKVVRTGNGNIVIYPNPVQNTIHVFIQSETAGKMMLQVTDMTGKTVITQSHNTTAGMNTIDIAAAGLSRGMYLIKIVQNSHVQTIRVVKQ